MKLKSFLVTFGSFILVTGMLYLVGHMFTIPSLMFHYEFSENGNGFFISAGSFHPLIIGLIVSFFAEKIYLYRSRQKLG